MDWKGINKLSIGFLAGFSIVIISSYFDMALRFLRLAAHYLLEIKVPLIAPISIIAAAITLVRLRKKEVNEDSKLLGNSIITTSICTAILTVSVVIAIMTFPAQFSVNEKTIEGLSDSLYKNYYLSTEQKEWFDSESVASVAEEMYNKCDRNLTCFKQRAYTFVRDEIEYKRDESEEFLRPIDTLYRGKGDCEDMAHLLASILKNKINRTYLLDFEEHRAVGVCEGGKLIKYDPSMESQGEVISDARSYISEEKGYLYEKPNC